MAAGNKITKKEFLVFGGTLVFVGIVIESLRASA